MDVRDLSFDAETFDVAIDKGTQQVILAGLSDSRAMLVRHYGRNVDIQGRCLGAQASFLSSCICLTAALQNPPANVISDCMKETDEALRYLTPIVISSCLNNTPRVLRRRTGIFLYLTFGQPHFRRQYLVRPGTQLEIKELGDSFHYYLYTVRKL
jgi:hypothetical protein